MARPEVASHIQRDRPDGQSRQNHAQNDTQTAEHAPTFEGWYTGVGAFFLRRDLCGEN
jgi:hypothetical protein